MVAYSTTFRLANEQYRRIYNDLLLVGPGTAAFYRDACHIMEADPPFDAATHLVSHCLREFESALRDVLRPVAMQLFPPVVETADTLLSKKREKKQIVDEKVGHKQDIRQILHALAIPESDWVTQQWLYLAPKREEQYGFASRAHRNNLAEPRPLDDEFRQLWRDMNAILERVLDAFKARYLTTHQVIDARLVSGSDSLENRMKFLTQNIPQNPVTLAYFFTSISEQQSIEWIRPLREAGYFRVPPQPDYNEETETTRYYPWPASQYLVQVAKLSPQEVLEIILDIPQTENVRVYEDCVKAACQMPPAIAQHLVPRVIEWLQHPSQSFLADQAGTLTVHLTQGGEYDAALQIFAAFLNRFSDLTSPYDLWKYARILKQTLPSLVTAGSLRVLVLLTDRLEDSFSSNQIEDVFTPRDSSLRWPMIETAGEERPEEMDSMSSLLISLTRQAAEQMIQQQPATFEAVLAVLQGRQSFVFTRLALYLLSRFPHQAPEAVADFLTNRQNFAHAEVRREYRLLLQAAFGNLAPTDQRTILDWIEQGPEDLAEVKATYERYNPELFTAEMERMHIQRWQRDWYARLGPALPTDLQPRYEMLVRDCGPAELPEESSARFIAVRWGTTDSPKTVEELCAMRTRELVAFFKNWNTAQPDDPQQRAFSERELIGALRRAVEVAPLHFSGKARHFRVLSPHYIEAMLEGLIQAVKKHQPISWPAVIDLCLAVTRKRTRQTRGGRVLVEPKWKDACGQVIELLVGGCTDASSTLSLTLREQVWTILYSLTQDVHPTLDEEQPFVSDHSDRIGFAETTIRGKALLGALVYAEWVVRLSNLERDASDSEHFRGLILVPEVQSVFEAHLDVSKEPSLVVHSLYGQFLSNLVQLDFPWVRQQLDRIFPQGDGVRPYRQAAWDAYCVYCSPTASLSRLLDREYRAAVANLHTSVPAKASANQPEGRLVYHIVYLACQGIITSSDPDGLLSYFFSQAPVVFRRLFWEEVGIDLMRTPAPLASTMVSRLQALWEWRLSDMNHEREQMASETEELASFRWWFLSGKFPTTWSLSQLEATLRLHGTVDAPSTMAEHLAEFSETEPLSTVRCLSLLVQSTHDEWKPGNWPQQVRTILGHALSSGISEAQQLASEVIHRLGVQGEDYQDLL